LTRVSGSRNLKINPSFILVSMSNLDTIFRVVSVNYMGQ